MKQRIDSSQLQQLSPSQQEKLRGWWKDHKEEGDHFVYISKEGDLYHCVNGACNGYFECECQIDDGKDPADRPDGNSLPLLSIGQCIELLREKAEWYTDSSMENTTATTPSLTISWDETANPELIDCLFQALKSIL